VEIINKVDTNKDGKISHEEFTNAMREVLQEKMEVTPKKM